MSKTATAPAREPEYRRVPIGDLRESRMEYQKHEVDGAALEELVESIKARGVLVPLVVRPIDPVTDVLEIVCGSRRYRAARAAGLEDVPVQVRELSDEEAAEIQMIENLQRQDVHPLDEALGYQGLAARGRSVEEIAVKVSKSEGYVFRRMALAQLVPRAQKLFFSGGMQLRHAMLLCRLQAKDQTAVLEAEFRGDEPSVGMVQEWIERNVMLDLGRVPWKLDDAELVPAAGACTTCLKRTGANKLLFADVRKGDLCTDPACFAGKQKAQLVQIESAGLIPIAGISCARPHGRRNREIEHVYRWRTLEAVCGRIKELGPLDRAFLLEHAWSTLNFEQVKLFCLDMGWVKTRKGIGKLDLREIGEKKLAALGDKDRLVALLRVGLYAELDDRYSYGGRRESDPLMAAAKRHRVNAKALEAAVRKEFATKGKHRSSRKEVKA